MKNMMSKLTQLQFQQVDDVVWDLTTGELGVDTAEGIATLTWLDDDTPEININVLDSFSMPLPAFAQSTPIESVVKGDMVYSKGKLLGWVTEVNIRAAKAAVTNDKGEVTKAGIPEGRKFKLIKPDGTNGSFNPPKKSLMGMASGVMVVRSLATLMGGTSGLAGFQQNLMPLMMMNGGDLENLEDVMPMLLMSQMGAGATGGAGGNNMFLTMLLMQNMGLGKFGKSEKRSRPTNSFNKNFFDRG